MMVFRHSGSAMLGGLVLALAATNTSAADDIKMGGRAVQAASSEFCVYRSLPLSGSDLRPDGVPTAPLKYAAAWLYADA